MITQVFISINITNNFTLQQMYVYIHIYIHLLVYMYIFIFLCVYIFIFRLSLLYLKKKIIEFRLQSPNKILIRDKKDFS